MNIEIKELTKKYSSKVTALNNVSLSIDHGMFGLLGRNGSGKTTLMRIMTTLLEPTTGEVSVLGMQITKENRHAIKESIGYLPQEFGFHKEFTVFEILEYICIMRGIDKPLQKALINSALEKVNLQEARDKKYRQLSGGMKRRVGLAQAMISSPPILIVDEPTAGVDPEERIKIRNMLSEYAEKNTVLLSTHIVEDIEYTCDKLAILDSGNLLFSGTLSELLGEAEGNICENTFNTLDDFKKFELDHPVISFKREGIKTRAVSICGNPTPATSPIYRPTLEDAYVYITHKGANKR